MTRKSATSTLEVVTMNPYGAQLQKHWQNNRATEYAQIEDPETFFTDLGEQTRTAIQERQEQLEQETPQTGDYLAEVRRLQLARRQAEEEILTPLLLTETGTSQP